MVISDLISNCADLFYVNKNLIISKSRLRTAVRARQALAMALSIRGHSASAIGRWLDRDHTTIIYNLEMAKEAMERDSIFGQKVFALAQMVHPVAEPHPQRHKQKAQLDENIKTAVIRTKKIETEEDEDDRKYSGPTAWGCDPGVPTHNNLARSLAYVSEKLRDAIDRELKAANTARSIKPRYRLIGELTND